MKLTVLKYGETLLPEKMAFKDRSENEKILIDLLFFLIETGNRKILVDTGCDTMPGFELIKHKSPVEVLEKSGIGREEVTDIIITHAHHDHIDGIRHYKDFNLYLHENELEKAKKYLSGSENIIVVTGETEVEKGIVIKPICGHSKGSCIVIIDKNIVLCGDECYLRENLTQNVPTASSHNYENSRAFTEEYRNPMYKTVLFHEHGLVENLESKVIYEKTAFKEQSMLVIKEGQF